MRLHAVWPIGHAQTANIAVRDMTRDGANSPINAVVRKFEFSHGPHHRRPIGVSSDTLGNFRRRFGQAIPLAAQLSSSLCETHRGRLQVFPWLRRYSIVPPTSWRAGLCRDENGNGMTGEWEIRRSRHDLNRESTGRGNPILDAMTKIMGPPI